MGNAENGAQPQLSKRAQIANPFRAMVFGAMADEMIANGTDVVKLSLGEPDFGAPPAVRDAMREQYDGRPLPYTAAMGLPELRQAISDFYKERHHVDVDPKRIAITAGGSTALLLSAALTVNDDDEVLIADPSYPCNRELVRAFGGKVVDVPTSAATRFHLTPELCKEYWTDRTKAVMITSPSNPTGTTIAFDTLKAVCDLARERGAWRIVDETYLDLADREPDGSDVKSVLACDPDAIVCSSFSKFFGMTGWRLGWMVVPEYALEAMDDLATNFFLCAHTPTQHAALACFTPETLAVCEERRQELLERLYEILAYHTFGSKDGMLMHIIHHKVRQVRCTAAISYAADDIIQFPVIRVVNAQRATGNTHCLILLFLFHTIVLCSHMGELSTIKILHYLCSVGQYLIVTAMNVDNNTCPRSILRFFSLVFHYRFILISNYSRLF